MEKEKTVDLYVHENALAMAERIMRRQWIVIIILIFLLVASNALWIWYESQFEEISTSTTETVQCDANDGGVAISNRNGEVNYHAIGEDNEDGSDQESSPQDGR